MSDLTLFQTIVMALGLLVFCGLMLGAVAALTLLRRRRFFAAPPPAREAAPETLVAPDVTETIELDTAPLPELPPDPVAPPAITIAMPVDEPPALLIEPDEGPTQQERNIRRLIDHLKHEAPPPARQA